MEIGIEKAVRLAGSQTALAKLIGVSPQAVQKWVEQGFAPARRCRPIEQKLSGAVTRYELSEEVFGSPGEGRAKLVRRKTSIPPEASPSEEESNEELRRETDLGYRQPADPHQVDR